MKKVIGREYDCDIVLENGRISRHHAKLLLENGRVYIKDTNSSNGTFINGHRISAEQYYELRNGDELSLAGIPFDWRKYVGSRETIRNATVGGPARFNGTVQVGNSKCNGYGNKDDIEEELCPNNSSSNDHNININYVGAHVNKNAENGADWKVPLKERLGSGVGTAVGNTLGCLISIVIVGVFLFIVFGGIRTCA